MLKTVHWVMLRRRKGPRKPVSALHIGVKQKAHKKETGARWF